MTAPKVYVTTYSKYNNGYISGAWLNVEDYTDKDNFLEACEGLHGNETDPEFMFQDWEVIPDKYISESTISPDLWSEWLPMDEFDRILCELYWGNIDATADLEDATIAFADRVSREIDFVYNYVDDTDMLRGLNEQVARYFDYEALLRDMKLSGDVIFIRHKNSYYVFFNRYILTKRYSQMTTSPSTEPINTGILLMNTLDPKVISICQGFALDTVFTRRPCSPTDFEKVMAYDWDEYQPYIQGFTPSEEYEGHLYCIKDAVEDQYDTYTRFAEAIAKLYKVGL